MAPIKIWFVKGYSNETTSKTCANQSISVVQHRVDNKLICSATAGFFLLTERNEQQLGELAEGILHNFDKYLDYNIATQQTWRISGTYTFTFVN
jgi:hypothetical protein